MLLVHQTIHRVWLTHQVEHQVAKVGVACYRLESETYHVNGTSHILISSLLE